MATKKTAAQKLQKIEIIETYIDKELQKEIRKGTKREVSAERAKQLIDAKVAKKI